MKHALNDVIMEYYFLTSSICLVPHQLQDILPTPALSAPSSPVVTKGNGQMLELSAISLFIKLNEVYEILTSNLLESTHYLKNVF